MIYQDYLNQQELQRYASSMNARAKRVKAKGLLTAELLCDRIFESGGRCEWCHVDLVNQDFELDHVQSLSQQGHNTADNLVVACPDCNRRKSGKHPARFASEIYSETGQKTALLDRILHDYEMTPKTQMSLFDTDSTVMDTKIEPDDDSSVIPPYKWS
jgi:hypothetical protein